MIHTPTAAVLILNTAVRTVLRVLGLLSASVFLTRVNTTLLILLYTGTAVPGTSYGIPGMVYR